MLQQPQKKVENALDFNLGGGSSSSFNSQTQPSSNDFNTMQNLFQSNSGGQLNFGAFNQTNTASSQLPTNNNFTLPNTAPNTLES